MININCSTLQFVGAIIICILITLAIFKIIDIIFGGEWIW